VTRSRLGAVVATGSRSTVHARGRDAVVKVPRAATPDAWIRDDATYSDAARHAGAPVPEFLGFDRHRGRLVSIYRRARGPAMSDALIGDANGADAHGRTLARLQADLAALVAPVVVPRQFDRLRCKLRLVARHIDPALAEVAALLPAITRSALCHGDLHPSNIVLTADGPMLVDWFDACRGDPVADVARTWLLLSPRLSATSHLGATPDAIVDRVRDAYLDAAHDTFAIDDGKLAQWQAVVAVARIAEGFDPGRLLAVWRQWELFAASGRAINPRAR
jgi:Ser/Thr protein kinase RdoA (MazF antagonist)